MARTDAEQVAELEELVSTAQEFWRGALAEARARHTAEMRRKDAVIRLLKEQIENLREQLQRRDGTAASAMAIYREVQAAVRAGVKQAAAEAEVATKLGITDRTVRRRLQEARNARDEWFLFQDRLEKLLRKESADT